jgi:hypothetical protein
MLSVAGLGTDSAAASGGGFADQVDRSGAGVSKNTVKAAWASDGPLKCERAQRGSIVNAMEPPIRELLKAYPQMPATVIAERIDWPTPNSGIDLSTLGATLDVRVNGDIHTRLREASDPSGGFARFRARSRSLICGRCLVGESATHRGFVADGWRYIASSEHLSEPPLGGLAGSPKAGAHQYAGRPEPRSHPSSQEGGKGSTASATVNGLPSLGVGKSIMLVFNAIAMMSSSSASSLGVGVSTSGAPDVASFRPSSFNRSAHLGRCACVVASITRTSEAASRAQKGCFPNRSSCLPRYRLLDVNVFGAAGDP